MANSYVGPQLSSLLIMRVGFPIGTASWCEVLSPPLLQTFHLLENAVADREEKIPSSVLRTSYKFSNLSLQTLVR